MFSASIIAKRESATIQARGRSYRSQVHVVSKRPEAIMAKVSGSRLYTTSIFRNRKGDYEDDCDCPYGATCKHIIALAYVIEADDELRSLLDISEKPKIQEAEIIPEKTTNEVHAHSVLDWLDTLKETKS